MKPIHVESSNIEALGHESDTLFIRFNSGLSYSYADVPETVFKAFKAAKSVGKFFHQQIKGRYHFTRLNSDPFTQ